MSLITIFLNSYIFGMLSNLLGGIIGFIGNIKSEEKISEITGFTAGITTSIICFEMLVEAFGITTKYIVIVYILLGIGFVKIIDILIYKIEKNSNNKSALLIITAMSAHNITEGIAIGSAFGLSNKHGLSLLIAIMIHNIPEGMIISIASKKQENRFKPIFNACNIIGMFLGIGAILGNSLGNINNSLVAPCLSVSAGAMLYIVACELIPGMNNIKNNNKIGIIYTIGFLIGCIMCT